VQLLCRFLAGRATMFGGWSSQDWHGGSPWRDNTNQDQQWWGQRWSGQEWGSRKQQWWDDPWADKKKLRRMNTDEGKDYSNRTYLGGEERTSLTREDRLKLVWAAMHTLEPEVENMWKPGWIQRADLQLATGTQLDALIYLLSKFQPSTNLRSFNDLQPETIRQAVRDAYASRQPQLLDRSKLLDEISRHRDHLEVLVRWAEYNHFRPGADPKVTPPTGFMARAPRCPNPNHPGPGLGWLYILPQALTWGKEPGQAEPAAPGVQQMSALTAPAPNTFTHALARRSTDEDLCNQARCQHVTLSSCRTQATPDRHIF